MSFTGFYPQSLEFLSFLRKNNNKDWFRSNKKTYIKFLVEPAKLLISDLEPYLKNLDPEIRTVPKFNETILRMNKDMRFNKSQVPYRTYFLIHFGRKKGDSEFYVYLDPKEIQIGLYLNNSGRKDFLFKKKLLYNSQSFINIWNRENLNDKFSLYYLKNGPLKVLQNFNINKHFSELHSQDHILLQKIDSTSKSEMFSSELLNRIIQIFQELAPIYHFAINSSINR